MKQSLRIRSYIWLQTTDREIKVNKIIFCCSLYNLIWPHLTGYGRNRFNFSCYLHGHSKIKELMARAWIETRNMEVTLCFLVLVTKYFGLTAGSMVDCEQFILIQNAGVSYGLNTSYSSVISSVDCARRCLDCHMVSYDNTTKECKVFQELNTTLTYKSSTSSVKVWIRQRSGVSKCFFFSSFYWRK